MSICQCGVSSDNHQCVMWIVENLLGDLMVVKTDLQNKLIYLILEVKHSMANIDNDIEDNYLLNIEISKKNCLLRRNIQIFNTNPNKNYRKTGYVML